MKRNGETPAGGRPGAEKHNVPIYNREAEPPFVMLENKTSYGLPNARIAVAGARLRKGELGSQEDYDKWIAQPLRKMPRLDHHVGMTRSANSEVAGSNWPPPRQSPDAFEMPDWSALHSSMAFLQLTNKGLHVLELPFLAL